MRIFGNAALLALSIAAGVLLSEGAYRIHLWLQNPQLLDGRDEISFGFYDRSHWEYDEEFGYVYPPGREILLGTVADGRLTSCDPLRPINARGNIGPIRGDYDTAALKILLFGDSFPAYILQGETFPSILQSKLNDILGADAHVVNFGRDGVGILQMLDLAAARVPEWRPDLAIVAFITDDLDRVRIWRTVTEVDGETRVLVSDRPDPAPDPAASADAFLLHPEATPDWCRRVIGAGGHAPELDGLVSRYRRLRDAATPPPPDLLSLGHSFLLARLRHGDALRRAAPEGAWQLPRLALEDYRDDPRFVAALARLRQSGVPVLFVHLPIAPELADGAPALDERRRRLWRSLEAAVGAPVRRLAEHIVPPLEDPLAMSHQPPTNHHPSLFGMQVYAAAIARLLAAEGWVDMPADARLRPSAPGENGGEAQSVRSEIRCPIAVQAVPQPANWTVFRSFDGTAPGAVEAFGAGTGAAGDGQDCRFRFAPLPAAEGHDWRVGHALEVPPGWAGRTVTFQATLRADTEMRFGHAAIYAYDGRQVAYHPFRRLSPRPRTLAVQQEIGPEVEVLEIWLRLALGSTVEPGGTVTLSDVRIDLGGG